MEPRLNGVELMVFCCNSLFRA